MKPLPIGPSVGIVRDGYPETRNILGGALAGVRHTRLDDRLSILHKLWHRLSGKSYSGLLHSVAWPGAGECTLVHTFNAVVLGHRPWVVTYETSLPRQGGLPDRVVAWAWRELARPRCRAMLSLSECSAVRLRAELLENRAGVDPAVAEAIDRKLSVLHPPQPVWADLPAKLALMDWNGPLRLAMVGHDFYRKGGLEVLLALDHLAATGRDIRLSIAGKMNAGDYASRAGEAEIRQAEEIMGRHPERVERLGSVAPERVREVLRGCHLLCLPTWGDTYGYSVLEGQASGCAAVTTNLRALPEINHDGCGWVIEVPRLVHGDGDLDSAAKRARFRTLLVEGLVRVLREAHDDRNQLRHKAEASLARIRTQHDPAAHAARLLEIYEKGPN